MFKFKAAASGFFLVGPMLWGGLTAAHAENLEPAPDCVQYHSENGRIFAQNQCIGGPDSNVYLKTDIDSCKYLGMNQNWATADNRLYRCTPSDNPQTGTGSAGS